MQRISVFCGSKTGHQACYAEAALQLGLAFKQANLGLVYGGSKIGLMGILADTLLQAGGEVIGVMPVSLANVELAHEQLSALHIVDGMHERKALMADLSDAVILMPGGIGSLDEFFEMVTWAQLGYHKKPLAILNVDNYYSALLQFLDHAVDQGFLSLNHKQMILVEDNPMVLVEKIQGHAPEIQPRY